MPDKQTPIDELKAESAEGAKDARTRRLLYIVGAAWLLTLALLVGVAWNAYFTEKAKSRTLAQQIAYACKNNQLGPGLDDDDEIRLCENADKVIDGDNIPEGIPGPQGDSGSPGSDGANGLNGSDGENGRPGRNGVNGEPGSDGSPGPNGPPGDNGTNGDPGSDGTPGADGKDGASGDPGSNGPQGEKGDKGDPGEKGEPGVTNVTTTGCDGPIISNMTATYDAATQTIVITCNTFSRQ